MLIGRQGGERILAEEVARRLGHHQLRGDLRDLRPGAAGLRAHERRARRPRARALGGEPAWIVGGAVRDRLLGRDTTDLDLALAGDAGGRRARGRARGARHGVRAVRRVRRLARGRARPRLARRRRAPARRRPRRRPRRARLHRSTRWPSRSAGGELLDPHGGRADLEARRLRMVSAAALADDPLRTLRAARLATELELAVEPATAAAVRAARPGARRAWPRSACSPSSSGSWPASGRWPGSS